MWHDMKTWNITKTTSPPIAQVLSNMLTIQLQHIKMFLLLTAATLTLSPLPSLMALRLRAVPWAV
jgi:hypothetical protein